MIKMFLVCWVNGVLLPDQVEDKFLRDDIFRGNFNFYLTNLMGCSIELWAN